VRPDFLYKCSIILRSALSSNKSFVCQGDDLEKGTACSLTGATTLRVGTINRAKHRKLSNKFRNPVRVNILNISCVEKVTY